MTDTDRLRRHCGLTAAVVLGLAGAAQAQEAAAPKAPPAAAEPERLIDVFNYRVEGNTVLPRIEVERAVLPYLGPKRKMGDIEAARTALEKAYRDKGFETVGVEIPKQDVRGGIVKFAVVELKVGQLRVLNARYFSPEDIKQRMPSLTEGGVPNYKAVSDNLQAINTASDRTITPTLRAGAAPGTVDVDLQVEDRLPVHGSVELNDRSSSRTRRLRVSGSASYANLFQREHSANVQVQFAPTAPAESWVASASYVVPVQGTPFSLVAYGVHSKSDVTAIGGIGVLGSGDIAGLRGTYSTTTGDPLQPWMHQFTLGLDYKNFRENLIVGADTAATPIDYVPLTAQYSLARRTKDYDLDVAVTLTAGIRSLGASEEEFRRKRYNASASWISLRSELGYVYKPGGDWRASAKLSGQFAGRALIANEQFSAGGLDSVRGYYESQELGDDGASAQFEIQSPSFHAHAGDWMNEARVFIHVDGAATWVHDPLGDQSGSAQIGSAGGGLTLRIFDRISGSAVVSVPFTDRSSVLTDIGDTARVQMRLWANF